MRKPFGLWEIKIYLILLTVIHGSLLYGNGAGGYISGIESRALEIQLSQMAADEAEARYESYKLDEKISPDRFGEIRLLNEIEKTKTDIENTIKNQKVKIYGSYYDYILKRSAVEIYQKSLEIAKENKYYGELKKKAYLITEADYIAMVRVINILESKIKTAGKEKEYYKEELIKNAYLNEWVEPLEETYKTDGEEWKAKKIDDAIAENKEVLRRKNRIEGLEMEIESALVLNLSEKSLDERKREIVRLKKEIELTQKNEEMRLKKELMNIERIYLLWKDSEESLKYAEKDYSNRMLKYKEGMETTQAVNDALEKKINAAQTALEQYIGYRKSETAYISNW